MINKTIIIAEAGVNHNGDINLAKKLVESAADSGADYVKFQTFIADEMVSRNAKKARYQIENGSDNHSSQFEMIKNLELTPEMHDDLIIHCNNNGIKFLSTAFDFKSIKLLKNYKLDLFKIPSGEITNLPYLEKIAKQRYPLYIMSTGMCNLSDIEHAINVLEDNGVSRKKITILHCNTEYPTPIEHVNLTAMHTIRDAFKVSVGYSDHTLGVEIPIAAVAMGAKVIEKHFTLDNNLQGPDHKASLEPSELKQMVSSIRKIENALGDGIKKPSSSEKKNMDVARKSIVAKAKIKKGEKFTNENITIKRPGNGISPMKWYDILDTISNRDYNVDDLI